MGFLLAGVALVAGWALTGLVLRGPSKWLRRPPHLRENYRGHPVAGTLGLVLFAGLGAGAVVALASDELRGGLAAAGAGAVMGGLGFLDDLYAQRRAGGFAGHLRALARGQVTTGLVKAVGGGVVGLGAAWVLGLRGWWILVGGAVVALTTNLVNLFDLRPGRAAKVWLAGWAASVLAGPPAGALVVSAGVAGGLIAFLPADLKERGMLGDTGANLMGAVLGVLVVAGLSHRGLVAALGVLVALTALSEVVSFSRIIERVPPLRALDRLGRAEEA